MADGEAAAAEAGSEIWGTLEELVLACAVSRHGTASWESVAMEVKTRSPLAARPGLTPHSCRLRFRHLHRRFSVAAAAAGGGGGEDEVDGDAEEVEIDASAADAWVGELRRLRVAELRREVERCDLSIGSLQTKVKQLREERERSLSGEAKPEEAFAGDGDVDRLSGEEPGRSCRESNSTDLKPPAARPGDHHGAAVKEEQALDLKHEPSGESVAASKEESSDIRSSASLSLCRRRKSSPAAANAGGDDDEEAASAPRPPGESQPLAALLDTITTRFAAVFQRLHESQESAEYRGTIRRHVDLEMVRRRLEASGASGYPAREFYRDVLLLCTNAAVFFPRSGAEHAAALDARAMVCASLGEETRQERSEGGGDAPGTRRRAEAVAGGGGADIVGPLIEKARKPIIVCRKRSSIAKAAAAAAAAAVKEEASEKKDAADDEGEESGDEKKAVAPAATKDKAWGMRTKKSRGLAAVNRKPVKSADGAATAATTEEVIKKGADSEVAAADGVAKKRNAKDFLKRLKQGSSPSKKRGSPLGTLKRAVSSSSAAAEEEHQQKPRRRGPGRKEVGRGGSKMGSRATSTKRGVGRPLKRGPAPATPPPPSKRAKVARSEKAPSGKRGGRK